MLPNASLAIVEVAKVRDYLLSATHPIGRFKAVVLIALGYTQQNWPQLRDALIAHAVAGEAHAGDPTPYGWKYTVSGTLVGPNGRSGKFKTVWLIETVDSPPKFLTAYPE